MAGPTPPIAYFLTLCFSSQASRSLRRTRKPPPSSQPRQRVSRWSIETRAFVASLGRIAPACGQPTAKPCRPRVASESRTVFAAQWGRYPYWNAPECTPNLRNSSRNNSSRTRSEGSSSWFPTQALTPRSCTLFGPDPRTPSIVKIGFLWVGCQSNRTAASQRAEKRKKALNPKNSRRQRISKFHT